MSGSLLSSYSDKTISFHRPDILGRIIGNIVLTNKKAQFVITHKLFLLQYKYEVWRSFLGYVKPSKDCTR